MGIILELLFTLPAIIIEELMCLIIPEKRLSKRGKFIVELIVVIFTSFLLVSIFLGIIMLFNEEAVLVSTGKYMIFIPLAIIALQSILGIIVKIATRGKNKPEDDDVE